MRGSGVELNSEQCYRCGGTDTFVHAGMQLCRVCDRALIESEAQEDAR